MLEADLLAGETIGSFRVEKLLGEGGMAYVYLGHHLTLEQPVAIKVLFPEFLRRQKVRARFKREAKLQFKLQHPNIVRVIELFEQERLLGMVLDYVDGGDLSSFLKNKDGPCSLLEIRRLFLPILRAMHYAHENGVIHRDLKPHNLMLHGPDGEQVPKVMDFGIARTVAEDDLALTKTGVVIGTPYYLSPEQAMNSKTVDHRTDIYALGITLYQMLTGFLPFHGDSAADVISKHCFVPPPSLGETTPHLEPGLDQIVQRALAKLPDERYQSCLEFADELEQMLPRRAGDTDGLGTTKARVQLAAEPGRSHTLERSASPVQEPADEDRTTPNASFHTRLEGWKQEQEEPFEPLPSGSSVFPAASPENLDALIKAPPSHSPSKLSSSSQRLLQSAADAPPSTLWLMVGVLALVVGIVGVLMFKNYAPKGTKSSKPVGTPVTPVKKTAPGKATPALGKSARAPVARKSAASAKKAAASAKKAAVPAKKAAGAVKKAIQKASAGNAGRRSKKRRAVGTWSGCLTCVRRWFKRAQAGDLMAQTPGMVGGRCNQVDFRRAGRACRRRCGTYLRYCKAYLREKTGACRQYATAGELLRGLRRSYKDSQKSVGQRCLREWK